jgi:hypothetical protein
MRGSHLKRESKKEIAMVRLSKGVWALVGLAVALVLMGSYGAPAEEKATPAQTEGFVSLFNGKDTTGWTATGAEWLVRDGCLVGTQTDGKGGDLTHEKEWDNFELRVTYRVKWPANSGIWFRFDGKGRGYQFDILKYVKPVAFSGTLYCPGKMFITANLNESIENRDGWNEARIWAVGDRIIMWLNGKRVSDCTDKTHAKGKIGFQVHPGNEVKGMEIVLKKIEVRPLKADEPPPPMTDAEKPPQPAK